MLRALRPDAADPAVRGRDPPALPARRGARHDAPVRGPGGGRGRRLRGARPTATASPAPTAATATRSRRHRPRAARRRDARARDRDLRRPCRIDERRRPRARPGRLLRHRRRRRSAPPPAPRCRRKRTGNVAVAFFGDGATNQAYFHECLNFAAGASLPVVFVCENNLYGEFTPMQQVTGGRRHRRAARPPTGCRPRSSTATTCGRSPTRRARRSTAPASGGGPTLLEARTYRHYGHSKSDPATYRPKEELERWLERDPIEARPRAPARARASPRTRSPQTESDVRAELDRAVEAALAAPVSRPRRGPRDGVRAHERARVPRRDPRRDRRGAGARPRA